MSLESQVAAELRRLVGLATNTPQTSSFINADSVELDVDFLTVDSVGCAFVKSAASVPWLANAGPDVLRDWADGRSADESRICLSNIGPLEFDAQADPWCLSVRRRQRPAANARQFYEIVLHRNGASNFSLRRYRVERSTSGRDQVDLHSTHEVLTKLATDLEATLPAKPTP